MGDLYALILAGGRGTRFWPRSRRTRAKQVLQVLGEQSLIQQTFARLRPLIPPERFLIITNTWLREEIVRQLPEVPAGQVIAEPAQRNTAPCIGLAARILLERDPEAVMGVFPADHVIQRQQAFLRVLERGARLARRGSLVVLGIRPRWPETGYGYIEFAGSKVRGFREKPNLAAARRFLRRGNFFWNSGMFLWKAAVIDRAIAEHLPDTAAALAGIRGRPGQIQFQQTLEAHYQSSDKISIDYGVMEKASNIAGIRCPEVGWNDVGSWNAVYELLEQDGQRNVARSEALFRDASGNYVDAPGKLVALVGLENVIVVDTPEALLITRRDRAQQVGEVVKALEERGRWDLL